MEVSLVWSVDGMLPVLGWRLYYGDGSTFSHLDGEWEQAPHGDVQVLEYLHAEPYRTLVYGEDEYRLTSAHSRKFGKWMDEAAFYALVDQVTRG
jgi:hypothetical protein